MDSQLRDTYLSEQNSLNFILFVREDETHLTIVSRLRAYVSIQSLAITSSTMSK